MNNNKNNKEQVSMEDISGSDIYHTMEEEGVVFLICKECEL